MSGKALMPGRGRKPKPNARKKLSGSDRVKPDEPTFSQITHIDPPGWLDELAVTMWEQVSRELCRERILAITDVHNLEIFCCSYSNWRAAQDEVSRYGVTVKSGDGNPIKNPALTALNEASRQIATFGAILGLDPASRQRLVGSKSDTPNRFDQF